MISKGDKRWKSRNKNQTAQGGGGAKHSYSFTQSSPEPMILSKYSFH